ncbi:MAG: NAD(P)H-hydrate epimerase [Chloroflexota bacterium]
MTFPHVKELPYLTTEQMREVDRAMIEDYGIQLMQMMENAGRALAHVARIRFLNGDPGGKRMVVLSGTGGNGGGALASARRLHNYGATVHVVTTREDEAFAPVPRQQLDILRRMGVTISEAQAAPDIGAIDLIIDGLIGYSLRGAPRGVAANLIRWANNQEAPILALDTPSGLETTSGTVFEPAIQATATLTLALPKEGLRAPGAEVYVGELYLADISVPPALYARPPLNLTVGPIFANDDTVRLH